MNQHSSHKGTTLGKRLRVALVVDHFLPRLGGIELHVRDLAGELRRCGCEPTIVTTTPGADRVGDVPVIRFPSALLPRFGISCDPRLWTRLHEMLAQGRFDVVHCHGSVLSPLAYSAVYWSARLQIPHVLTVHSLLQRTATLFSVLARVTHWDRNRTIWSTVSQFNAARIEAASGLPRVHVLPNGIDASTWRICPRPHAPFRVTTVMRLNQKKRPYDMVDAAADLVKRRNDVRFTIVGDGPCRVKLKRYVIRRGLQRYVDILGTQDRSTIRKLFETTDIFALPTRMEAFGIAVLEAMAAGLPVVAVNRCGVTDLVTSGIEGLLASNVTEFAAKIEQLLNSPSLRTAMSQAAAAKAECFDWNQVLPRHLQLYDAAIAGLTPFTEPARVDAANPIW